MIDEIKPLHPILRIQKGTKIQFENSDYSIQPRTVINNLVVK